MHRPFCSAALSLLLACSLGSCDTLEKSAYVGASDATARDVLQLVGSSPDGFGRKRLEALKSHYVSVGHVCATLGDPDMMYQTCIDGTGEVLVLFYSDRKQMAGLVKKSRLSTDFKPAGTRPFAPAKGGFEQQARDFFQAPAGG